MARIVVIGSLNLDLVAMTTRLPGPGETLLGRGFTHAESGKGANQAFAAARLGGDVAMLGRVGDDDAGRRMRANLVSAGCDVENVRFVSEPSGVALIFVSSRGENAIVVVPGANDRYSPAAFEADRHRLAGAEVALLQLETPIETVTAAARAARAMGARVVLDPTPAPASLPAELLGLVDVLTPNESEAARLIGHPRGDLSVADAGDIARLLQVQGARAVVIKLGRQGCLVAEETRQTWVPLPRHSCSRHHCGWRRVQRRVGGRLL